jgi:hypothetical protein
LKIGEKRWCHWAFSVFLALSAFRRSWHSEQLLNLTREPMNQNEAIICQKAHWTRPIRCKWYGTYPPSCGTVRGRTRSMKWSRGYKRMRAPAHMALSQSASKLRSNNYNKLEVFRH